MAIFFTIAGTNHHYGSDFMEKDMKVFLEKEPDNDHDREAIKVTEFLAQVDTDKCIGCGKCAEVCPRHIITLFEK